ncbi:MAG: flagellar hook-basal body complex protein FliE [Butyricicoccus sp.]|nr:flagellar hook-basal body complex protein FliE [Butyricicoccus pullicaecorum]
MFITPMIPVRSAAELSAPNQTEQTRQPAGGMFVDIFQQAINNVKETENEVSRVEYQLATGQLDDIHSYTIAASKAAAAGELMIQLRSRALDAYNELMRINL